MNMSAQTLVSITKANSSREDTSGLVQLERQVERGHLFAHSALGENSVRLGEVEVLLHGLIDTLLAKGIVNEAEILATAQKVRSELIERNEVSSVQTIVRLENPEENLQPPVEVDCRSRLHICQAVCCKLDFALSIPEMESGKVKWDLGRPYFIRHDSRGACVHLNSESGGCRIYEHRPSVCRGYSCAFDKRIWNDFEKMELNQDWIDANVSQGTEPRMIGALMHGHNSLSETVPSGDEAGQGPGHV
jgi:Fe-S-cluster containining protein